jgi:uncharacterized protein with beta-barrel porin domain
LALAAGVLIFTVLPNSSARADCQLIAAATVDCTAAGGTQTTPVGTGAENNVTVTVQPGATVNVPGANAIDLFDGNTVTNSGTIIVDTGSAISVNDNNTITNIGTIIATGGAFGISAVNGNNVTNSGIIRIDDFGTGINVCCDNTVLNSGSIVGGEGVFGIFAGDRTNITNSGSITVGGNGGYGILADGDGFIGPGNATITNSGSITAGDTSIGIGVGNNYNVINTGTIVVGDGSLGIQADGGNTITNSGSIRAGAGSIGIFLNGLFGDTTPNTLTNNGSIIAPSGGAIFGIENNTIINNGYIQGQIALIGDSFSVTVGNSLTNNGYIIAGDPAAFVAPSGISIEGTLINGPTGTFAIRVAPTFNDSFIATTIQLAGRLQIVVTPGLYNATTTYSQTSPVAFNTAPVQICGCGGVSLTGTFSSVVSTSPFFTATADYSIANEVDVTLTRIPFGSVPGMTPNQRAVGNALEGSYSTALTGNAATFYSNLLATTTVTVLDNLSGEGISATQNAAFSTGSLFNNAMQTQGLFAPDFGSISIVVPPPQYAATRIAPGHDAFASLDKTAPVAQQPGRFRIWSAGFGASQSLQGEASTGSYSQSIRSGGGVLGADWQAAPDLRVGAAVGASESSVSVASLSTSGRLSGGHVGLYAMKTWNAYYAAASVSYANYDNTANRTISGVGPGEQVSGRFGSDQVSARLELGWKQTYQRANVTPFVAIEPAVLWQRGFTETDSNILGLNVASQTVTSFPTFVGVQVDGRFLTPEGAVFAPYSRVSWVHEFEPARRVSAAFITLPGAAFTVDGARAASDAARLDAGAKLIFHRGQALFANFSGEWSGRTESYAATGGFRMAW